MKKATSVPADGQALDTAKTTTLLEQRDLAESRLDPSIEQPGQYLFAIVGGVAAAAGQISPDQWQPRFEGRSIETRGEALLHSRKSPNEIAHSIDSHSPFQVIATHREPHEAATEPLPRGDLVELVVGAGSPRKVERRHQLIRLSTGGPTPMLEIGERDAADPPYRAQLYHRIVGQQRQDTVGVG